MPVDHKVTIMARAERDREDLLAEATALVERAELALPSDGEHVVFGFRSGGQLSIYFGAEAVYQFNADGKLRRAYIGGQIHKAQDGRLVSLERRRNGGVLLLRHELDGVETGRFLAELARRLDLLAETLASGQYRLVGQVPPGCGAVVRLHDWLQWLPRPIPIAAAARVS